MRIFITIIALTLTACGETTPSTSLTPEWQSAAEKYKCTEPEMNRVHTETKWCIDNTSYFKSYCYGSAIMRNCTKIQ